jgi:SAM-dependent methyltransferase
MENMPLSNQPKYSKRYYNDVALRLGHKLYGLEYLHYGYFKDVPITVQDLPRAQEAWVDLVLSKIPAGAKDVMDVGCGTGGIARELVKRGYNVTCVDPDPFMIGKAKEKTGGKIGSAVGKYEEVTSLPAHSFDVVMMPESCQYINKEKGWPQNAKHLRSNGHVLIADFFKIRSLDQPHLSKSGHEFDEFVLEAEKNGFKLVEKIDITREVAPTMDLYQAEILNKVFPIAEAAIEVFQRRFNVGYKLASYFLRDKVLHLKKKYENQDSDTFSKYKGYFVLLFKRVQN